MIVRYINVVTLNNNNNNQLYPGRSVASNNIHSDCVTVLKAADL